MYHTISTTISTTINRRHIHSLSIPCSCRERAPIFRYGRFQNGRFIT